MKNKSNYKNKILNILYGFKHIFCLYIKFFKGKHNLKGKKLDVNILSPCMTLDTIYHKQLSVIRFGDGEFSIIKGKSFPFQNYEQQLSMDLLQCLLIEESNVLVCIPGTLINQNDLVVKSKWYWTDYLSNNIESFSRIIKGNYIYGDSMISRPYLIYRDKKNAVQIFDKWKKLWQKRNVLLIEGEYSRCGVGNDLFSEANVVKRILCPSVNAYSVIDKIYSTALEVANLIPNPLVLVALGPTAKPLVVRLSKQYWTIDLGHLDSEYEWCKAGTKKRIQLNNKHTAELGNSNIQDCCDEKYQKSIVKVIST